MRRTRSSWLLVNVFFFATATCLAQQEGSAPAFEVASVKRLPAGVPGLNSADFKVAGFEADGVHMLKLISVAYQVPIECIDASPQTLERQGFNEPTYSIVAKASGPVPVAALRLMLRTLLVDRFHLRFHAESRTDEGFALTVSKSGLKIKPTENPGEPRGAIRRVPGGIDLINESMDSLASFVARWTGRTVMNLTGVDGLYTVTLRSLENTPDGSFRFLSFGDQDGMYSLALRALGLELSGRKVTREHIVVDSMLTTPTEN